MNISGLTNAYSNLPLITETSKKSPLLTTLEEKKVESE